MIIFDLDGTLADCEHRRHLINPEYYEDLCHKANYKIVDGEVIVDEDTKCKWRYTKTGEPFKTGWHAFFEACDKDEPIKHTIDIFESLAFENHIRKEKEIEIWSGRCESVKDKTLAWLEYHVWGSPSVKLKMRPIGDTTPDDELKEMWLHDATILEGKTIDFVFDDRPKVIRMWRRRGIFVFNCCQHDEEF